MSELPISNHDSEAVLLPQAALLPPPAPHFGALRAFLSLVLMLLGQGAAAVGVLLAGTVVAVVAGVSPDKAGFAGKLPTLLMAPLILAAAMASAAVALLIARAWAWDYVTDCGENGIGIRPIPVRAALYSLAAGLTIAGVYVAVTVWFVPFEGRSLGPLAAAAARGGATRAAWALIAVAIAPIVEEFFFRGLLLKGFTATWGVAAGAVIVTILFVAMHLTETASYWPAVAAIASLAIATLAARMLTKTLAAPVLIHLGYNVLIVVCAYILP
jgi:membrane protease YdiL (CAAX protease family)